MARLIDLSHHIEHGMTTYPGLPAAQLSDYLTRVASQAHYATGTTFHIGRIDMVANTGTYLDTPFHRYAEGKDLSELPFDAIADLDALTFRADRDRQAIGADLFLGADVRGKAVLIDTGWDRHWGNAEYFHGHPHLTADAAAWLRDAGAALVGIDSLNIDDIAGGHRPAHTTLLAAEIPIVEHLCALESLPQGPFKFFAVPAKVRGFGTFPVRAFALVPDSSVS